MQIKGLHKNIYKLASYALSQENLSFIEKNMKRLLKAGKN